MTVRPAERGPAGRVGLTRSIAILLQQKGFRILRGADEDFC